MMEAKWGLQNITDGMNFMSPHWNLSVLCCIFETGSAWNFEHHKIFTLRLKFLFLRCFVCVDECWLMPFTDLLDFYYFSCIFFNRYYFWILGVCSFLKYPCVTLVFTIGVFHFNYRKKVQGKAPIYALEEEEEESPSTYNN